MKTDELTVYVKSSHASSKIGHEFFYIFPILRSDYWLKYRILEFSDVAIYETLQCLCECSVSFTLEFLIKKLKWSKKILQQRLDNLENAELLETVLTDQKREPNFFVLRTPMFAEVLKENALRLKTQVNQNRAKQLRELQEKTNKSFCQKSTSSIKNIGLAK